MPITYLDRKPIFNGMQIDDIELDGIDTRDYPDFCDAYINNMWLVDGDKVREATDTELDEINNNTDFIHEQVWKDLF